MSDPSGDTRSVHAGDALPRHVAIVMDGNGRWARKRLLPRHAGHRAGAESVRKVVETCGRRGVEVLTLFAFSSENWKRPKEEVGVLMELFLRTLEKEKDRLHKNNVRVRVIGERTRLNSTLQERIAAAEAQTASNTGLTLVVAASYGGRWDIAQAARRLAKDVRDGRMDVEAIDENAFDQYVCLSDLPTPDLFIRTGGEHRISNFLLWQLAYSELYFTETLWPDFGESEFQRALDAFAGRQRRFGLTGDQVGRVGNA